MHWCQETKRVVLQITAPTKLDVGCPVETFMNRVLCMRASLIIPAWLNLKSCMLVLGSVCNACITIGEGKEQGEKAAD